MRAAFSVLEALRDRAGHPDVVGGSRPFQREAPTATDRGGRHKSKREVEL